MIADNTSYLRDAERQRHTRLLDQAHTALRNLDTAGEPITVAAVVRESGLEATGRQTGLPGLFRPARRRPVRPLRGGTRTCHP